jgi:hypothetical protein
MALAWKAGWVNALAGSNPASSAMRCLVETWRFLTPREAPRACLLAAYAVMDDDRGEGDAAEVGHGVFVVAGGDRAPLLASVEPWLDSVAAAVELGMRVGVPTAEALALRRAIWSDFSGMVWLTFIFRSRRGWSCGCMPCRPGVGIDHGSLCDALQAGARA